ncbi:hypothetical protein HAX54_029213 [Datura stramonium]|uniref:Uncharacterized protein n=1 Tax=Datura stramonium TaxID=4076 RepID=A0ABS8V7S8_DATST|nr:hypothetical protein [Datura stramonium]
MGDELILGVVVPGAIGAVQDVGNLIFGRRKQRCDGKKSHSPLTVNAHKLFDEMPISVAVGSFDKLASVSEKLIDWPTGNDENDRTLNQNQRLLVELVVSPPNNDDLDWQSERVDNAYSHNIDVNDFTGKLEKQKRSNIYATAIYKLFATEVQMGISEVAADVAKASIIGREDSSYPSDPSKFPFDPGGIITLEDKGVVEKREMMQYEFGSYISWEMS